MVPLVAFLNGSVHLNPLVMEVMETLLETSQF